MGKRKNTFNIANQQAILGKSKEELIDLVYTYAYALADCEKQQKWELKTKFLVFATALVGLITAIVTFSTFVISTPDLSGEKQLLISIIITNIEQAFTGENKSTDQAGRLSTPVEPTSTVSPTPFPTNPNAPTLTGSPVLVCPGLTRTGLSTEISVDLSVPDGYIQYLWGSSFDAANGIVLIRVFGPYEGHHRLYEGGYCDPVVYGSADDAATFEQVMGELGWRTPTVEVELR